MRIHGGHKLDIEWAAGKLKSATIHADKNESCIFLHNGKEKNYNWLQAKIILSFDTLTPIKLQRIGVFGI